MEGSQSCKEITRGSVLSTLTGVLWRLLRCRSVRFAARFSPRYSHSIDVIGSARSEPIAGLCQNRSRSAIGIILLSGRFWLATLIREQRWCVALSRASSPMRACWTPAFPPELNYLIRLPPCSASFPYPRIFLLSLRSNSYSLFSIWSFIDIIFFDILCNT